MRVRLVVFWGLLCLLCACAAPQKGETPAPAGQVSSSQPQAAPEQAFDEDLTKLNDNMRYSEVMYIQADPERYLGKTIKVQGYFYIYESDIRNVYVCLVPDSTACCTAGLEFRLAGEHKFPDDYPKSDELITVAGTFGAYSDDEGEHTAYELQDAYFLS